MSDTHQNNHIRRLVLERILLGLGILNHKIITTPLQTPSLLHQTPHILPLQVTTPQNIQPNLLSRVSPAHRSTPITATRSSQLAIHMRHQDQEVSIRLPQQTHMQHRALQGELTRM